MLPSVFPAFGTNRQTGERQKKRNEAYEKISDWSEHRSISSLSSNKIRYASTCKQKAWLCMPWQIIHNPYLNNSFLVNTIHINTSKTFSLSLSLSLSLSVCVFVHTVLKFLCVQFSPLNLHSSNMSSSWWPSLPIISVVLTWSCGGGL